MIAVAFALAVVVELRSKAAASLFFLSALVAGIWPYLRNLHGQGIRFSRFFQRDCHRTSSRAYALQNWRRDTGASSIHGLAQIFPVFVFRSEYRRHSPGFWDFFGPTVLALAPLILFASRNTRAWRVPLLVWFFSSVGIFFASGLPRFLLPLFPMALACVAAGFEVSLRETWRIASRTAAGVLVVIGLRRCSGVCTLRAAATPGSNRTARSKENTWNKGRQILRSRRQ